MVIQFRGDGNMLNTLFSLFATESVTNRACSNAHSSLICSLTAAWLFVISAMSRLSRRIELRIKKTTKRYTPSQVTMLDDESKLPSRRSKLDKVNENKDKNDRFAVLNAALLANNPRKVMAKPAIQATYTTRKAHIFFIIAPTNITSSPNGLTRVK